MNFVTSIVRKATRKPTDDINVLVAVDGFVNRDIWENTNIIFYTKTMPGIDYDLVIADKKNLEKASQFAMGNHLLLLKSQVLDAEDVVHIIQDAVKLPYLNHPYSDKVKDDIDEG